MSKLENLQEFEALLLGYQNNKEAQQHAARILVGKQGVHGKLPVSIHPNFPAGRGIDRNSTDHFGKGRRSISIRDR